MAIEGLKWVMDLMDRTSGPARRVVASLNAVRVAQDSVRTAASRAARTPDPLAALDRATGQRRAQRQRQLGRELEAFARQQGQASSSSGLFGSVLSGVGSVLMTVGAAAIAAAGAIAGVGASAARSVVELGGFQESTIVSMQTLLGSRGAANAEFSSALRIARLTPFDTRNVVSMRRQLLGAGFRDTRERDVMTGVLADLSAMTPEDSGIMQRLGLAVGQIRGAGRLRGQELNQLLQAGLSREHLFAALGSNLGMRETGPALNRRLQAMMEAGRITDTMTFAAMARAVQRQTNTTRSGQYSGNQSTTTLGLLSTLGSSIPELLLGNGPDGTTLFEGAGFSAFKGFLQQVVELLSSTNAVGQRLQKIMRGVIDEVFGVLNISDKNTKGGLTATFNKVLDTVENVIGAMRTLAKWSSAYYGAAWETLGPTLAWIAESAQSVMAALGGDGAVTGLDIMRSLGKVAGVVGSAFLLLWVTIVAVPTAIVWMGTKIGEVFAAIKNKIMELWSAIQDYMPDWLLQRLGYDISYESPTAGATGIVNAGRDPNAGRPIVSQPNVTVNVNAQAEKGSTPEDIAAAAGAAIPTVVQSSADRASQRGGR